MGAAEERQQLPVYNVLVLRVLERQRTQKVGEARANGVNQARGSVEQTQMKGWTGAATSNKVGQKGPRGHQVFGFHHQVRIGPARLEAIKNVGDKWQKRGS